MDLLLIFLLAIAFIGLLSVLKISVVWSIVLVLLLALFYIALRHPHGRKDWEHDLKTSLYFIVTTVLLIMMLYVMYLAAGSIRFPPVVTIVIWLTFAILITLVILGIFFPHGWKDAGKG